MSFSRNSVRVVSVLGLLCAFVLCQGQGCGGPTATPFAIVGSADPALDGTYTVTHAVSGQTTSTVAITLAAGVPTTLVADGKTYALNGQSHPNPNDAASTYSGTGQAGRDQSSFTMEIVLSFVMPGATPPSATQTLAYTGTIATDGSISGSRTMTVSAPGYNDSVTTGTFTMIKQ